MKRFLASILMAIALLPVSFGTKAYAFEYTQFSERLVTMTMDIMFGEGGEYTRLYPQADVVAAAQRLRAYIAGEPAWQAGAAVVTDVYTVPRWVVRVVASYDSRIQTVPSLHVLMDAYARLEQYVSQDTVLSSTCFYAGFMQGDHGDGG